MSDVQARTFAVCKHQGIEIHAVTETDTDTPYIVQDDYFKGQSFPLVKDAKEAIDAAIENVANDYRLGGSDFQT